MGASVVVISVLGSLGYLLVGWGCMMLAFALFPHKSRYKDEVEAESIFVLCLFLWPVFAVVASSVVGVRWLGKRITNGRSVKDWHLSKLQKMNPEIKGWF